MPGCNLWSVRSLRQRDIDHPLKKGFEDSDSDFDNDRSVLYCKRCYNNENGCFSKDDVDYDFEYFLTHKTIFEGNGMYCANSVTVTTMIKGMTTMNIPAIHILLLGENLDEN